MSRMRVRKDLLTEIIRNAGKGEMAAALSTALSFIESSLFVSKTTTQ